jgi:prepilin peptidase CpaA
MSFLAMPIFLKVVLLIIAAAAAYYDLRIRRIPNWINLSGVILGLGLNTYFASFSGTATAAGGLLVALCVYVPLYALKGMGAGDVKLMAAIGAIAGARNWLTIFIVTALLGGFVSLVLVLWRKRLAQTFHNISVIVAQLAKGKSPAEQDGALSIQNDNALKTPHGAIIASGVFLFVLTHWSV